MFGSTKEEWLRGLRLVIDNDLRGIARRGGFGSWDVKFSDAEIMSWWRQGSDVMVLDMIEERIRKAEAEMLARHIPSEHERARYERARARARLR